MTTIARYMYGRLILATVAIMVTLATEQLLYKSHDLYHFVVAGILSVRELLLVWAALLPVIFYHTSSEMVTIAVLVRYYLWRQHNEILTQRSMGRSCWQIAAPGIAVGACAGLFAAAMSLYALPRTFGIALDIRAAAELRVSPPMLQEGIPNQVLPGLSISFQHWLGAGAIEDVVLTDDRQPNEFSFVSAARAHFVDTAGDYVLVLENGLHFTHAATGEVERVSFDQLSIPLTLGAEHTKHLRGYYEEDIATLLSPPEDVRQDRRLWGNYVTEGHHRIINPLRCIGCALLLLGILVPGRQGFTELSVRLALALGLSFAEDTASTIVFAMAYRHVEAAPLLYLLPLASAGLGAALLCQGDRRLYRRSRWAKFWPGSKEPEARRAGEAAGSSHIPDTPYPAGVGLAARASLE